MLFAYLLMCLIYGTTFLAIKLGLNAGFSPFFYAGTRFFVAAVLVLLFLFFRRQRFPSRPRDYIEMISVGLCMTGIEFAAVYWAEQFVSSSFTALLAASTPLMVTLVTVMVYRKKIPLVEKFGILLGFIGVSLIVWPELAKGVMITKQWIIGVVVILVAEFFYALGTVQSRSVIERGVSPAVMNGVQMLAGSLFLLILSFLFEPHPFPSGGLTQEAVLPFLYLIVFGSLIASSIYYWLVKVTNPLFPSTWTYVSPVIAVIVGYLLLSETVYAVTLIGAGVVLAGVFLTNYYTWRVGGREETIPKKENATAFS